jgi:hypothetical protein
VLATEPGARKLLVGEADMVVTPGTLCRNQVVVTHLFIQGHGERFCRGELWPPPLL